MGPGSGAESIGERLRRLRIERGLSQRALSAKGVSYAYISRIEAGARTPSVKALRILARQLGVSVEYLETGRELADAEARELRLREAELELRLALDPAAAERAFRDLVEEATAAGDLPTLVRARISLGLAAQQRGDNDAAVRELEQALAAGDVSPLDHWELYSTLGRAYVTAGQPERAVELFESCLAELDRAAPDDALSYVRFATYLSYALADLGELARARELVAEALRQSHNVADNYTRVRLYWSYARIALGEERPRVALENLRRAVTLLEATEDTRQLGRAHLLWAEILTFDGRAAEAEQHLALARNLLGAHPDHADLCWLRTEEARAAAESGRAEAAIGLAHEALELLGEQGERGDRGTALWALGQAQASLGDLDAAIESLQQAVDLLEAERIWHNAAAAARRLGQILRDARRESDALVALERAVTLASRAEAGRRRASHSAL